LQSTSLGAVPFVEEALRWLPDASLDVRPSSLVEEEDAVQESYVLPAETSPFTSNASRVTRPRVLVADDNTDMRNYLRRLLRERYEVIAVADGAAALVAARAQPPDLLLADIMMPRLDGFGLLREWRGDAALKTIPVILLSARAGEESRVEGLDRGADDYLIKPFSARELLARVNAHVNMGRIRRQAEEVVRDSEGRFREMADNAPVMVWVTEPDMSCSFLNKTWYEFTGQTPDTGLGFGWLDAVHADDRQMTSSAFMAATKKRETFRLEYRLRRRDGEYGWVMDSAAPRFGRNGEFLGCVGSVIDITERKRAEEAKARLAAIVESSDDAIISKGLDGVITTWNAGAERLFGYTAQEAVGRHITMLMPPERLHEEAVILGRIRRGERMEHYETMRRRKDGRLLDISLSVSPVIDSEGRIVGASKIARDITGRKQQDLALITRGRQQRLLYELANTVNRAGALAELYEKALDTIISALHADRASILLFDDAGIMRFKAWRGLSDDYRRAVEGHSPWKRDTPDPRVVVVGNIDEAEIAPDLQEVIRREGIQALSFIPLMYGGRLIGKFMVYFNRPCMMDEEEINLAHTIAGTVALGIERKAGEETLRRLNEELEARIDDRTRDLVTSQERLRALATELNLTEQRERQQLATELHDYLAQLLALNKIKVAQVKQQPATPAVAKLLNEMQDVLDKALTYTRTLVAELSPPMLQEFGLLSALQWLAEQMKVHGLRVVLDAEGSLPSISEDQARLLFQSVRELLINITKHGQINCATVQVRQATEKLRIDVIDEGAGFDLAAAAAAAAAGTATTHSSKFGLFSIRERMIALGGEFHIASAVGQGTTATLVLPLAGAGAGQSAELGVLNSELTESATPAAFSTDYPPLHQRPSDNSALGTEYSELHQNAVIRVLLVDDHAMVRQGLRGLLDAHADITIVGEAATGEEALVLSGELQPHVVLMDVNMPGMDGVQSTRRIIQVSPAVKVIGLSIQDGEEVKIAMKKAGAVGFLNKEAAVDQLYRAIHDVVRDHSADGKP
jgi:PAS domain S-box-containing protein